MDPENFRSSNDECNHEMEGRRLEQQLVGKSATFKLELSNGEAVARQQPNLMLGPTYTCIPPGVSHGPLVCPCGQLGAAKCLALTNGGV